MEDLKLYARTVAELESLLNTVRIFGSDISMEFGLEKFATLTVHHGKNLGLMTKTCRNSRLELGRKLQISPSFKPKTSSMPE